MKEHTTEKDGASREPAAEPTEQSESAPTDGLGEARRAQQAAVSGALAEFDGDGEQVELVGEGSIAEFNGDGEQVELVSEGPLREGEDEAATPTADTGGGADAGDQDAGSPEEGESTVTVAINSPTIDLTKSFTLTATASGTVSNYTFEYKPASGGSWTTIQTGANASYTGAARIAGRFKVRVTADSVVSEEIEASVRFPSYSDIVANGTVSTACTAAWTQTKNATTATSRREQAFWVRLDTSGSGTYSVTSTIVGPTRTNTQGASVQPLPKPADTVNGDSRVYTVACFHTHTPMTYRFPADYDASTDSPKWSRRVGPSGADVTFHNHASVRVPGIVYDYSANVLSGHDINDAAQLYHCGPTRRDLPT